MSIDALSIIQAEYFHVDPSRPPEVLLDECRERALEGSRVKTILRFYDRRGLITETVHKIVFLMQPHDALLATVATKAKNKVSITEEAEQLNQMLRQKTLLQAQIFHQSIEDLNSVLKDREVLAVEYGPNDHRFRLADRSEYYDLIHSASQAKVAWFFVFPPGDLLADSHESAMAVM